VVVPQLEHAFRVSREADALASTQDLDAKGTGRNAVSHYNCLDFSALASLPVAKLAADDCALFLWATDPLLPRAFELIERWGFEYKTVAFYWVKLNSAARQQRGLFYRPRVLDARQSGAVSACDARASGASGQGCKAPCGREAPRT
jgi:hypothetical protein